MDEERQNVVYAMNSIVNQGRQTYTPIVKLRYLCQDLVQKWIGPPVVLFSFNSIRTNKRGWKEIKLTLYCFQSIASDRFWLFIAMFAFYFERANQLGNGGDAVNFEQTNQGRELKAFFSLMHSLQFGDTSL